MTFKREPHSLPLSFNPEWLTKVADVEKREEYRDKGHCWKSVCKAGNDDIARFGRGAIRLGKVLEVRRKPG